MKLLRVRINNFLGIAEAEVMLDNRGFVLVEGENLDSATTSSNGAGKSSIYEAIYWALFGRTKRGLTGDGVVNRKAKKDCLVALEFEQDGIRYCVRRCRKETSLDITQYPDGLPPVNLTKGTMKETQAQIEQIIRMSDMTFSKVTCFGQGDVKAFADLTDAELKQVFEQALAITYFTEYLTKAKAHKAALEGDVMTVQAEINRLEWEQRAVEEKIAIIESNAKMLADRQQGEIDRLNDELYKINDEMRANHEATMKEERTAAGLHKRIEAKEAMLEKRERLLAMRTDLNTKYREEYGKLIAERAKEQALKADIIQKLNELKAADAKVGQECGECGKVYAEEDISAYKRQTVAQISEMNERDKQMQECIAELSAHAKQLQSLNQRLDKELASYEDIRVEIANLKAEQARMVESERRAAALEVKKTEVERLIASLKAEMMKPRAVPETKSEFDKLRKMAADMLALNTKADYLKDEITLAEQMIDILGNQGLKSYIFDYVTPELNRLIQEYMNMLNPDIGVEVSTVSKLKSGEYREKFGIKVDNVHGADSFEGSSGGEKQMINLPIALAFNKIVRGMSGGCNVLFLDEPLENLDETASEKAIDLCKHFASDVPSIFLISHNQGIKDMVPNRMKIVKKGGCSRLAE